MAEMGMARMEARKETVCGKLTGGRMSEGRDVGERRARTRGEVLTFQTQEPQSSYNV
jgi:hypothetical protein